MDQPEGKEAVHKHIVVRKDSAYAIKGGIPLVKKTQVVSEYGEPLTWKMDGDIPTRVGTYYLCRCGESKKRPFCDGSHRQVGFDGTESADTNTFEERAVAFPGGTRIIVKKDVTLCMDSGFCIMHDVEIGELVASSNDTKLRSLVIAMVERCPSGSLTYRIDIDEPDIEPDLPREVAVTTEITSNGLIPGPLWVSGNIPIKRSDGQPFETRYRVTLCNCGHSQSKPLCDGIHRVLAKQEARRRLSKASK